MTFELIRLRFHLRAAVQSRQHTARGIRHASPRPPARRSTRTYSSRRPALGPAASPIRFAPSCSAPRTSTAGPSRRARRSTSTCTSATRRATAGRSSSPRSHDSPKRPGTRKRSHATALRRSGGHRRRPQWPPEHAARIRVQFLTPTELKSRDLPSRDRFSTLRSLYGPPRSISISARGRTRRSSRAGQTHPLGGFTGEAEYQAEYDGDLDEFLPYLRAGQWTGVGRQTVWGNGEICFRVCS